MELEIETSLQIYGFQPFILEGGGPGGGGGGGPHSCYSSWSLLLSGKSDKRIPMIVLRV